MDLNWLPVAIVGCLALALCLAAVLLRPMHAEERRLRPLANVQRLTRLPEYVRARRARTRAALITIALLAVVFVGSVLVASRPSGSYTSARQIDGADPEDVMVCIGSPVTDPAVATVLSYFADRATQFGTERVGLTSANRRVVPLTRDYQHLRETFAAYAQPAERGGDFAPAMTYSDYAESVEDQIALCLTGFPQFDRSVPQRRSLIYVGPGELRAPDDQRPTLFTSAQVNQLASTADVQVDALVSGPDSTFLSELARNTGGRVLPADAATAAHVADIRAHPPASRSSAVDDADGSAPDTPDVPLLVTLLAVAALAGWPVVLRS